MGYTYLTINDVDSVRNRKNKSVLTIHSKFPECFLAPDVAHPNEVKHLTIILGFQNDDDVYKWHGKYTDTLCSDIVNFHNLETLVAQDLNLSNELWIKFAQNSKHLREIKFWGQNGHEYDDFDFHEREKALDVLFKISTLERVCIEGIYLPYFPPGPSNIKHLELDCLDEYEDNYTDDLREQVKSYSTNFSTHTNIKSLVLGMWCQKPYDLKDLKLEKMIQLEDLELKRFLNITIDHIKLILALLPNLKKLEFGIEFDKIKSLKNWIKDSNLKFPNIEEIVIYVSPQKSNLDEVKKELEGVFKKHCNNIKNFEMRTHFNKEKLNVNMYDREMIIEVTENCLSLKELIYDEPVDIELLEKLLKMPQLEKIEIGDLELEGYVVKEFNFDQEFLTIEYLTIRPEYDNEEDFLKKKNFLLKFKNCCPNLKSLKLYNTKEKEFIEFLI
jgi:hypothetical protein